MEFASNWKIYRVFTLSGGSVFFSQTINMRIIRTAQSEPRIYDNIFSQSQKYVRAFQFCFCVYIESSLRSTQESIRIIYSKTD